MRAPSNEEGTALDLATLIGLVLGLGLIIGSMAMGGPLGAFFNLPGLLVVAGGTFAALFIAEAMSQVLGAIRIALKAFIQKSQPAEALVPVILDLSNQARRGGIVSLEGVEIEDPFLSRGISMAVDGLSPEVVEATLQTELEALRARHDRGQQIFRFMGATAPSMGMIGTLIGLVQMLGNLSDPSAIGPAMAVALLTTLYGAIMAFLICIPIADKLEHRSAEEVTRSRIAILGVSAILNGDNNLVTQSKLTGFLAPRQREQLESAA